MAPRIGYTMDALLDMQVAACASDVRLVWKKDDEWNMGVWEPRTGELTNLPHFCGVREMRLFALQLLAFADERERANSPDPHTEVLA